MAGLPPTIMPSRDNFKPPESTIQCGEHPKLAPADMEATVSVEQLEACSPPSPPQALMRFSRFLSTNGAALPSPSGARIVTSRDSRGGNPSQSV